MRFRIIVTLAFFVVIAPISNLRAARTDCVSQMALADLAGDPISTSVDYEIHFYPTITGGAELITAATGTATPSNGVLSIQFDCSTVTSNTAVFMEYVINNETMSPRVEMVSSPFAATAFTALNISSEAIANDSITTNLITDGTITSSDIATDAITSTTILNGTIVENDIAADTLDFPTLSDNLTLDASTNISESGTNTLSITNSGSGSSLIINDQTSDTTPITFTSSGDLIIGGVTAGGNQGNLRVGGFVKYTPQDLTVDSNGNGTAATFTITPHSSFIQIVCNDFDGCSGDISEAGAETGQTLLIANESGNPVTITGGGADARIAGGTITMGNSDSITLIYGFFNWIELSRNDN
ncbi:MAG: hypothetical protein IPJ69_05005 [Deltaproteobacteria bacterium]|nr:MAG: hypothetical protein IPJ69_05005 [Deltaproteobacteria bacterium]